MRVFRFEGAVLALSLLAACGFVAVNTCPAAYGQSNISGDVIGSVTDPSGAAVSNAQVTVTSQARGEVKVVTSDGNGNFRVPLLSPGKYKVSVTAAGFQTATADTTISAGVVTPLSMKLTVGQTSTTIEVTGGANQILHTDDAQISTSFDLQQIQTLPNPGNDLTFVAQTTPGAVMNTQGGYGNFSVNGLPGTSNTFTVNGGYEGDPYLNLNNSGATNLLLGNNDVDTVTVITNSYDAAFGGLGGAQVNEISRSGTNKWHGNMAYWWNGRAMNANSFFNKHQPTPSPRSFDNANQWAAAVGGPLRRDKIFGFVDTEGIRVIIPQRGTSYGPSPAFQAAILGPSNIDLVDSTHPNGLIPYGNLAFNGNSSEAPVYQKIFDYYNKAKNFTSGHQDPDDPDTWIWNGQTTNFGREWLVNDRVDLNLSNNDHLYIHSKSDHGIQPTGTSFLDPVFDAQSPQPSYEGQLSETHTFAPTLTNQFLFGASYYRAIFTNTSAGSLAGGTVPFVLIPEGFASDCVHADPNDPSSPCIRSFDWDVQGSASSWIGNIDYALPQGRNVTGYQFNDDLSWTKGRHNLKLGFTMRRDDITDYTSSEHNSKFAGGENIVLDQSNFASGYGDEWVERFPQRLSQPVALYVMGAYVQDQWKPIPNLTLTAGLRLEHNSNPVCVTSCVSNFSADYDSLPTVRSTPYKTLLASGRKRAFLAQQNVAYEPRIGFSFLPGGPDSKTTIRGGFGMFADYFPAQIMGDLLSNLPNVGRFTVLGAAFGNPTTLDATSATSGHAQAVTSNDALQSLFSKGACYRDCGPDLSLYNVTGHVFTRPTVFGTAHKIFLPTYEEWSLAVEHEVAKNTVVSINYIGNRSYHQPILRLPNAFDSTGTTIASLPAARPNGSLGSVNEYYSGASSNYNGVIATASSRINWLTMQFNYAFGHALDNSSNGGFNGFGVNPIGQINPHSLAENYGNADYDTRHYISANYAITPHFSHMKAVTNDWEMAGTVFHNTGYPFSVLDNSGAVTFGATPMAKQLDNHFNHHCGGSSHIDTQCDFASHFASASDYNQQHRNQLYGPNYTDFDLDVAKGFKVPKSETAKLKVGVQFFNLFNHANFQIPLADVNDGPLNGTIYTTANTPTSILGAFLGGDASPRLIQFKGSFVF